MIGTWPFRAVIDPSCKRGNVFRCKLRFLPRWHVRLSLLGDDLHDQRVAGITRLDHGAVFTAFHQRSKCLHGKFALKINVIVATGTVFAQDGSNVLVEINRFPESGQCDEGKN